MSRIGINYHEVENAAIKLQSAGKNPTVDRVREILGTGSKSTIARHLKTWQQQVSLTDSKTPPPELISMVTGIWSQLQEKAAQQILDMKLEYEEKKQEILKEKEGYEKELKTFYEKVNQLKKILEEQSHKTQKIHQQLSVEHEEKTRLFHQSVALEDGLKAQKAENEKLYQLLSHVQKNLEHYQFSMQRLQQKQSLAMDHQKGQYEKTLSDLREQLSFESTEKNKLFMQLEQKLIQLEHYEEQTSHLSALLKEKEIQEALLKDRYASLAKQHDKHLEKLEITMQSLMQVKEKNVLDENRIVSLSQNLLQAEERIQLLQQQYALIAQEKAHLEGRLESVAHKFENKTTQAT